MSRLVLICEIRKKTLNLSLIEVSIKENKKIESKVTDHGILTKDSLKSEISKFLTNQKLAKKIDKKIVVGCFFFDEKLTNSLELKFSQTKFNGSIIHPNCDLTFIDKHELICLNDYSFPSQLFDFNKKEVLPGKHGLIISIGNHIQCFEENIHSVRRSKEIIRIDLAELSFVPNNDFENEFSTFVQNNPKENLKNKNVVSKNGFKLAYLFHLKKDNVESPKEPSLKELLMLIQEQNPQAIKAVEFFFVLLSHFLYSCLIMTMPDKELILTGNFLKKIIEAYNNDEKIKSILIGNLFLTPHVKHKLVNLRISLQTNMDDLVIKSVLENF